MYLRLRSALVHTLRQFMISSTSSGRTELQMDNKPKVNTFKKLGAGKRKPVTSRTNYVDSRRRKSLDVDSMKFDAKKAESLLLYKDEDVLAIDKPAGLAVHGGPQLSKDLSQYLHLWQYRGNTPHLAHRLDKDVSGVLLLTRNADSARRIAEAFRDKRLVKTYWAITVGVPVKMEGSMDVPLGLKNVATQGKRHAMNRVVLRRDLISNSSTSVLPRGVHPALTRYKVLSVCSTAPKRCCLMEVQPITGIKHQVRVHLADGLMCPILGDHKFGGPLFRGSRVLKKKVKLIDCIGGLVYLHAYSIEIPHYHRNGKSLIIKAPPSAPFMQTAKTLGLLLPG